MKPARKARRSRWRLRVLREIGSPWNPLEAPPHYPRKIRSDSICAPRAIHRVRSIPTASIPIMQTFYQQTSRSAKRIEEDFPSFARDRFTRRHASLGKIAEGRKNFLASGAPQSPGKRFESLSGQSKNHFFLYFPVEKRYPDLPEILWLRSFLD